MRTRTRRSVARGGVRRSRQRDDRVDQRGRHERTQLRDGPAPVHDLQHAAQRRVGEHHRRAAAGELADAGALEAGAPAEGQGARGVRDAARPVRAAGTAVIPTGGGSQSMIGVVNDTGSGGMRDAVIGALQRSVRRDGICWRVADTFMIARFDDAECTRDARTQNSADSRARGFIDSDRTSRGGWRRMVTRLSASDASFYHLEDTSTPMYVGTLSILRKPRNGLSYETLLATVERRLPQIPRYRQKVREVTLGLARPVWVDDRDFDITYHIRRSALPSPGSDAQLHELIARLGSRPLDKSRPLWEMYLIEGLARTASRSTPSRTRRW